MWERHATFKAFWRLLFQGRAVGEPNGWVIGLTALSMAGVGAALVWVSSLGRWLNPFAADRPLTSMASRDRLIAAAVAATPLLMPFYFDYDLLLLAVPAVLFAADLMRRDPAAPLPRADRGLLAAWPALYGWMLLNPDVAERTRVNLAAPLLAAVCSLLIARAARREAVAVKVEDSPHHSLARAA